MTNDNMVLSTKNLNIFYGAFQALKNISIEIERNKITAFIGPSGCGKSTFLRSFNRMNDLIEGSRFEGEIRYEGKGIQQYGVIDLRKKIGMVFQKPNPFSMSIYENVAFGLKIHGVPRKLQKEIVENSLKKAFLWDEVKDKLNHSALRLSGGQQQRLCIARTLAIEPEVILMDEPTSALDPVSTRFIENLLLDLKKSYTILIVTHNMQQAGRVSDYTVFFLNGILEEMGKTEKIFFNPEKKVTEDYITGRFG